jgi:pimeloyl-ACP methyl ester carboxylesterase
MTAGRPLDGVVPVRRLMSGVGRWIRSVAPALFALALVTASCTSDGVAKSPFHPTLRWETCPSDVEVQYFSRHRCGWLTVLQERAKPAGKTLRLLVVETWPVGETPLPGLDSGFGSDVGKSESYGSAAAGATRTHHISFHLEPRGTGHSQPSLACPEIDALDTRGARTLTGDRSLLRDFLAAVTACRDRLSAQGVVPADYDVHAMAQDMEDLRVALHIDRWAFLNSYGTNSRSLLEYIREFPDHVGGVWMDSPQFPQVDEVSAGIDGTRYALDQLFKTCADDAPCAKAYPDLQGLWERALIRLEERPFHGSVSVDAGKLLRAARFILAGDGPENLAALPAMISASAHGRLDPQLAAIVAHDPLFCSGYRPSCTEPGAEGFSLGVYLTVLCRDEAPFIDPDALARKAGGDPTFEAVFVRDPYLAACKVWNVPPAGPTIHQPVHTDVPQLLLSGQFDSFSPSPVAKEVAKTFGNAWVLEIPGQTHNALGFSDCPIGIRNEWIRDPMSPPAGTTCLGDMGIVFQTRRV